MRGHLLLSSHRFRNAVDGVLNFDPWTRLPAIPMITSFTFSERCHLMMRVAIH